MKNIQITVDEETLRQVDRVSGPMGLKRSEVVRQALRQWLQRRATERFEEEWIAALGREPDDTRRAEDWLGVQSWSRR
jgi:metal-responsive CopG/Arc/MetJ family transcriptional regulator